MAPGVGGVQPGRRPPGPLQVRSGSASRIVLRMRWILRISAGFLALSFSACASTAPKPGVGDVSFRLTWSGVVDLDLYVVSPLGERLSFIRKSVDSGGVLDIDCNVRPFSAEEREQVRVEDWLCPQPMENVFWPRGDAPEGTYRYWLVLAWPEGLERTDAYVLEVRRGRRVVRSHRGMVSDLLEGNPSFELEYARQ